MKIGVYDPYLDDMGGGEKYMLTLAECLADKHEVDLFWDDETALSLAVKRFSIDTSKIRVVRNIFAPSFPKFSRLIKSKEYDCLIVLSDGSIPFVLSKKLFLHIQSPMPHLSPVSLIGWLKMKRVEKVFCNSRFTKSFVDGVFRAESVVIYPPVNTKRKDVKKENIILHVGRFRVKNVKGMPDYKKQGVMVSTFKEMVNGGFKGYKFILAVSVNDGQMEEFEKMRRSAKGYPIEFLVNRTNEELWEVYNKAKIYWHASGYGEDLEKHPEFAEHFGISTVEAMSAGAVPVVISAGGQKEIVENGVNGYLWESLEELKNATIKLSRDKELFEKLSVEARKVYKKYTKDEFCQKVNTLVSS